MKMTQIVGHAACSCAALLVGFGTADAADFVPFSNVETVCKACDAPAADVVSLNSSVEVRGTIVAENEDYLVMERYGEMRVVPKSEVASVEWASGAAPSGLGAEDQIILKGGHVLTGSIIEEKATPGLFRVRSSDGARIYVAFFSQIEAVYRAGKGAAVPAAVPATAS